MPEVLQNNDHAEAGANIAAPEALNEIQETTGLSNETISEARLVPTKLEEIARRVHEDHVEVKETVRTLLAWFDAKRRGLYVVNSIQKALAEVELTTDPDFTSVYIDAEVRITSTQQSNANIISSLPISKQDASSATELPDATAEAVVDEFVSGAIEDPTFRIGKLDCSLDKIC